VLAKWDGAVLSEGFVPLPKRLLRCLPQIFSGEDAIERFMVVMAIADYLRPNLTRGPSSAFLAFLSGLPVDRVDRILSDLKKDGLITVETKNVDELDIGIGGLLARITSLTLGET
jgi:hypothetical protein